MSFGKPVEKICEGLKKKDAQICDLRYGTSFTFSHISTEFCFTICFFIKCFKKKLIFLPSYFSEKEIDWNTVELKKLKVRELRKILNQWGEDCLGCAEKTDFIDKIEQVKRTHVEL